jgi:hypothetical protein
VTKAIRIGERIAGASGERKRTAAGPTNTSQCYRPYVFPRRGAAQRRTMPTALVKPDHNLSVPVRDRLTLAVATANPLGAGGLGPAP